MKSYLLLSLFFFSTYSYGQNQVSGKVVDQQTQEALMGVSVYINNTTFGAKTDQNGDFIFYCPILGNAEVVASHINYNKTIAAVNLSSNQKVNFNLKQKETKLNEVIISQPKLQSESEKAKWFSLFSLNLIGKYGHGNNYCKITNPEVLIYRYNAKSKELTVTANGVVEIENLPLGYKINLDLEKFEYSFFTDEVSYKYTSLYENLKINKFVAKDIITNRDKAYFGSAMHFMRALYSNNLQSEGFITYKYFSVENKEKKRVADIIRVAIVHKYETELNPKLLLTNLFSRDSAAYYAEVMRQPNVKNEKVEQVATQTLTTKNRFYRTINFNFTDTLRIDYHQKKSPKTGMPAANLKQHNAAKPEVGHGLNPSLSTYVHFFEPGGVNIENTGYYPDFKLFMYGDMAERRLANALPYDFTPTIVN